MVFLKLNEIYGGEVTVNMHHVWQITPEVGGNAKLWYSNFDADTLRVKESKKEIEKMLIVCHRENLGVFSFAGVTVT